jgi:hypothetical protein
MKPLEKASEWFLNKVKLFTIVWLSPPGLGAQHVEKSEKKSKGRGWAHWGVDFEGWATHRTLTPRVGQHLRVEQYLEVWFRGMATTGSKIPEVEQHQEVGFRVWGNICQYNSWGWATPGNLMPRDGQHQGT